VNNCHVDVSERRDLRPNDIDSDLVVQLPTKLHLPLSFRFNPASARAGITIPSVTTFASGIFTLGDMIGLSEL